MTFEQETIENCNNISDEAQLSTSAIAFLTKKANALKHIEEVKMEEWLQCDHGEKGFQLMTKDEILEKQQNRADNPIEFIIDLLNKCLVFRAGFTEPPLLYNKKHLESLFYLMDRMRTNYIDVNQYKTGMRTLGICSFSDNPLLSDEGLVAKDYFIEEAYNQLTDQLNDLLRRRWIHGPPPEIPPPPPTPQISIMATESSVDLEASCLQFTKTNMFLDCNSVL